MASFVYLSFDDDLTRGNIDVDTDTFYVMLVTSSYTPNKTGHDRRDDITNEVTGTGYTAGGIAVTPTVTKDTANNRVTIVFPSANWANATITAAGAVIYKRRGGASSADELVAFNDYGGNVSSTNSNFSSGSVTITRQNA